MAGPLTRTPRPSPAPPRPPPGRPTPAPHADRVLRTESNCPLTDRVMPMASRVSEWRPLQVGYLAAAALLLFVVTFWAALGQPPLTGTRIEWVLGFLLVSLVNLGLGTLGSGAVLELRHRTWSRLGPPEWVFMAIALVVLAGSDVGFAWWLFSSAAGAFSRWVFLMIALAVIALGAWSVWRPLPFVSGHPPKALWPHHDDQAPGDEPWEPFTPLSILLGCAVGVAVAIAYLGISAWHENADVPAGHPLPAALQGIHGDYLALGDSYSAGLGLAPYAPGTIATECDRSVSASYPDLLFTLLHRQDPGATLTFAACSGVATGSILDATYTPAGLIPPQVNGTVEPSVRLVTLTIGGNDAIFPNVVESCLISGNCLDEEFPPAGVKEVTQPVPRGELLTQWGPGTIEAIGNSDAVIFRALQRDYPAARIVVIGYPYLFPDQGAPGFPFYPPLCSSILNRLSVKERDGLRTLQDEFNDRMYEEAVAAGIEFVSPDAIWDDHEPCGSSGQYTNSIKPYLHFPAPINGGSFHPNAAGQQTLAALVACYLDAYHSRPDPFASAGSHTLTIPASRLVTPAQLGLVPAPGLDSVPGSGVISGC
jgi:lysophospholipase L1-like esterase